MEESKRLKRCSRCRELKTKDCFSPNKRLSDGLCGVCKECVNKRTKERKLINEKTKKRKPHHKPDTNEEYYKDYLKRMK